MGKILKGKELMAQGVRLHFGDGSDTILVFSELQFSRPCRAGENLDSKDILGKILQNNELAWPLRPAGVLIELLGLGAIARIGTVCVLLGISVKVIRHRNSISFA